MSLSPFALGYILGRFDAGDGPASICEDVRKSDGEAPTERHIRRIIEEHAEIRSREGIRRAGSGRPPVLTKSQKRVIVNTVFKHRGSAVVTVVYLKKKFRFCRKLGDQTIRDALHEAGLQWFRRRRKIVLKREYRLERVRFAKWILAKRASSTGQYAYVDGTTFYLARSDMQAVDAKRRRLGPFVWRMSSSKDGLYRCIFVRMSRPTGESLGLHVQRLPQNSSSADDW